MFPEKYRHYLSGILNESGGYSKIDRKPERKTARKQEF